MRRVGLSLLAGVAVVGGVWLHAQVAHSTSSAMDSSDPPPPPPSSSSTRASSSAPRAEPGGFARGGDTPAPGADDTSADRRGRADDTPEALRPILALSEVKLTPEQAHERYLETLRASGGNSQPWARVALEATDAMTRDLTRVHPDAVVSGVECHAAGCTFVVGAASGGALQDRLYEVMDHPALRQWQGPRMVLPVADVDGRPSQRWLLLHPTQS